MLKSYREKQISYFSHTRTEILPFLPAELHMVLDVGCAGGNFGQMLKELYSCTVWGVEPDIESAAASTKKIDRVFNTTFDCNSGIPKDQKFDCIFFNDVLEHLAEPEDALLLAKEMLSEGGLIIASIPNIRFYPVVLSLLRYKDFEYLESGVMDKTHLRFFTYKSMLRLFKNAHLKVLRSEGINLQSDFKWFNGLNFLLLNSQWDMKYPQFLIVSCK